jgi:hypothetical protein
VHLPVDIGFGVVDHLMGIVFAQAVV